MPRKPIKSIQEVAYSSKGMPLVKLYDCVILQKGLLENNGYTCHWTFVPLDGTRSLFLGDTDVFLDRNKKFGKSDIRVATMRKDMSEESFTPYFYYSPSRKKAFIQGSNKVYGQKGVYDEIIKTIKEFNDLTGIELKVSSH